MHSSGNIDLHGRPGAIKWSAAFHDFLILLIYPVYDAKCWNASGFQPIMTARLWRTWPCYAADSRPTLS